uniref:Ig-like domain-containing protein n=1 Tax=Poecilia latipinna TaxID=48699 RepID=A0A3B3VXN2_9TELE
MKLSRIERMGRNRVAIEVCHTLNVTVTPGPLVLVAERHNLTLSCLVSEKKWSNSVLILRWFFLPFTPIGIKKMQQYGNYSRRFPQPKFHLFDDAGGEVYRLLIINVTGTDQGFYSCRVQEIRKYKTTWRASSNGSIREQFRELDLAFSKDYR